MGPLTVRLECVAILNNWSPPPHTRGMTATIACPTCAGPVELDETATARCLIGHEFAPDELAAAVDAATSRALWAAVRALEDNASGARWRRSLGESHEWLSPLIVDTERHAAVLRELLDRREASSVDATTRPQDW